MLKRTFALLAAAAALIMVSATAASASAPAHPKWQSSAYDGTWNHDSFAFDNDMWNCPQAACGKQTIWANTVNSWGATSRMAAGNTAVLTYPDIGMTFSGKRVTSYHLIRNGFSESMPNVAGLKAEAADDVWLNNYKIEIMIWVDNIGQSFSGDTRIGAASIFGQTFNVWKNGSEYIFDLNHNETSGETHILSSIYWLIRHGHVSSSVTLTRVDFGWEISSTSGQTVNFEMKKYWLHTKR
jgi:hypothetical protein